jgi:dihydroflavonol-4-reductase
MIIVTGATGHIGNVLVRKLISRGEDVRAITPVNEDISPLKGLNIEIVQADIRDIDSLNRAFKGAALVYHLAGVISILPGKKDLLTQVNVKGTQNVVEACLQNNVRRLVYTSSIHAVKEPPHGTCIDESYPYDPTSVLGDYAKSKAQATLEVVKGMKKGLNAVIVCPTGVIGPGDYKISEMGQLILEFLKRKMKVCVNGAYDFVDVRDVAEGLILAGWKGRSGESYILSGERITIPNLFTLLEKISGVKAPHFKVPGWLARSAGIVSTPFYLLFQRKPLFTAYSIDVLNSNSIVSSAKARRELGFSPRSIQESVSDAVTWFKEEARRQSEAGKMRNSDNTA